jgi:hypothetical protein
MTDLVFGWVMAVIELLRDLVPSSVPGPVLLGLPLMVISMFAISRH